MPVLQTRVLKAQDYATRSTLRGRERKMAKMRVYAQTVVEHGFPRKDQDRSPLRRYYGSPMVPATRAPKPFTS